MSDTSSCLKMPFLQKIKRKRQLLAFLLPWLCYAYLFIYFYFEEMTLKITGRGRCDEDILN